MGLCAMYRYELKVNDITNLETLPSRLSNFISSVLTTVRDNSKFNINEFKIIFDIELCVIDVYSTKDFEELIPKFQLFSTDKKYSKVDDNDDKYFMPMKAKYDLHLNLSSVRLISKLIKDFIQSIQDYSNMFLYPIRITADLTESIVSVQMYDDFEENLKYFELIIPLPSNYVYKPNGLDEE